MQVPWAPFYFCHLLNVSVELQSLVLNELSLQSNAKIQQVVVTTELDPQPSCESEDSAWLQAFPSQPSVGSTPSSSPESYP